MKSWIVSSLDEETSQVRKLYEEIRYVLFASLSAGLLVNIIDDEMQVAYITLMKCTAYVMLLRLSWFYQFYLLLQIDKSGIFVHFCIHVSTFAYLCTFVYFIDDSWRCWFCTWFYLFHFYFGTGGKTLHLHHAKTFHLAPLVYPFWVIYPL